MKILAAILLLAVVVSGLEEIVVDSVEDNHYQWTLKNKAGRALLQSDSTFEDKHSAIRSAAAVLANGGNKDRCSATLGVLNVNNVKIGVPMGGAKASTVGDAPGVGRVGAPMLPSVVGAKAPSGVPPSLKQQLTKNEQQPEVPYEQTPDFEESELHLGDKQPFHGHKIECEHVHKAVEDIVSHWAKQHLDSKKQVVPKVMTPQRGPSSRNDDNIVAQHTVKGITIALGKSTSPKARAQPFFFHIKAANNGEIVLRSEMYSDESGAVNGLKSVLLNGGVKSAYEIITSEDKQFVFRLKALNHKIVGASETYTTQSNAERGRDGVQAKVREILEAIVKDASKKEQGDKPGQPKLQDLKSNQPQREVSPGPQPQRDISSRPSMGPQAPTAPRMGPQAPTAPRSQMSGTPSMPGMPQRPTSPSQKDDNDVDDDDSDVEDDTDDEDEADL